MEKIPPIKRKYFEHGLAHTREMQAALKTMSITLRALRRKHKIGQAELADLVGCSRSVIAHVELAQSFPSLPVYIALCRELGCSRPPLV